MITLPENKHITRRFSLREILSAYAGEEQEQKPAEMLLQHLFLHANDMQELIKIGMKMRDQLRPSDDDQGLAAQWDSLFNKIK